MKVRRQRLEGIQFAERVNPGLWLDKFIEGDGTNDNGNAEKPKAKLLDQASKIKVCPDYESFFARRQENLEAINPNVVRTIEIAGRMICGLGGASVWENSISIHRTYGVPYIPGSSLKGLAASYARKYIEGFEEADEPYEVIFGSQKSAGFVTFHDALLIPESAQSTFLHAEIMTVHHPDYYGNKEKPPADWDSPNPINFLSASGKYLVVLTTPQGGEDWLQIALRILEEGLKVDGVGAKTSSGYGRATFLKSAEEIAGESERSSIEGFTARVNALRPNDVASQINTFYREWKDSSFSPASKREMASAIIEQVNKNWKNGKSKAWYEELLNFRGGEE